MDNPPQTGVSAMLNAPNERADHLAADQIAVKAALSWSGWGSPVGLSVLVVSVGLFLVCLHWAGILH
jgi:hypothetical protein